MHEYLETDDIIDIGHAMTSVVHSTMTMPHQQHIITLTQTEKLSQNYVDHIISTSFFSVVQTYSNSYVSSSNKSKLELRL